MVTAEVQIPRKIMKNAEFVPKKSMKWTLNHILLRHILISPPLVNLRSEGDIVIGICQLYVHSYYTLLCKITPVSIGESNSNFIQNFLLWIGYQIQRSKVKLIAINSYTCN